MDIAALISPKILIEGGKDIFKIKTNLTNIVRIDLPLIIPFTIDKLREPEDRYKSFPR